MFSALYGNEMLKNDLTIALQSQRLSHAYLIEGPAKSGKHTLAKCLALALANHFGDNAFLEKIQQNLCPDIMTYGKSADRKTISVDLVRQIKQSIYLTPVELSFQLYILEDTDAMTDAAQNALLKFLEEPPKGVYFLLLCENASQLLPTVRSRAPSLRMEIFDRERLAQGLLERQAGALALSQKDPQLWAEILTKSNGVYGVAKELLNSRPSKKGQAKNQRLQTILSLLAKRNALDIWSAVGMLSSKREECCEELLGLCELIGAQLLYKKGLRTEASVEIEGTQSISAPVWMRLYDLAQQAVFAIESNANITLQQACFAYGALHALQGTKQPNDCEI